MQFTIDKKDFLKVINTAYKAVPAKSSFPMMENFLLVANDGFLHIKGTDGSIAIESETEADGEGETCINAKLLLDAISLLPDGELKLETVDEVCTIKYAKGQFQVPCFPVEDYPQVDFHIGDGTAIQSDIVKAALKYVLPSVATDQLRPAMCGVFFNPVEDGYDVVASDAHSMSLQHIKCEVDTREFIIPTAAVKILINQLPDTVDYGVVSASENSVTFQFSNWRMNIITATGKFPKYKEAIPKDNENLLVSDVSELLDTVKRVSTCASKASQLVKLTLSTLGGCTIEAQDVGFGCSAKESMDFVEYNGQDMVIGFKHALLVPLLNALDEDKVTIAFKSPKNAALFNTEDESRTALLMPVAVTN